jgi:hypothetical protein
MKETYRSRSSGRRLVTARRRAVFLAAVLTRNGSAFRHAREALSEVE